MVLRMNNGYAFVLLMVVFVSALAFRSPPMTRCSTLQRMHTTNRIVLPSTRTTTVSHHTDMALFAKEDDTSEGGVQTKYLVALGVFILAALYDYFVTHNGMKDGWVI